MKVPVYDSLTTQPTTEPTPYQSVQVSPDTFGAKIGEAMEKNADRMSQNAKEHDALAEKQNEYFQQTLVKNAMNSYTDTIGDLLYTGDNAFYKKSGAEAMAALPKTREAVDKAFADAQESLPSPMAKAMFADTASRYNTMYRNGMSEHTLHSQQEWMDKTDQARIENLTQDATLNINNPKFIASAAGAVADTARQLGERNNASPEMIKQLQDTSLGKFYHAVGLTKLDTDPQGLLDDLKDPNKFPGMSAESKAELTYRGEERLRSQMTIGKAAVEDEYKQAYADIVDNGTYKNEDALKVAIRAHNPPDIADEKLANLEDAHTFFNFNQKLAFSNPSEDLTLLHSMKPNPDAQDYTQQARRYNIALQSVKRKQEALDNDPAGYAQKISPELDKMWDTAQKSGPDGFDQYTTGLQAVYDKIGVPSFRRSVIPTEQAKGMVNELITTQPDMVKAKLDGMAKQYGDKGFHAVMGDLVKNKLPAGYGVLAAIDDPRASQAVSQGLSAKEENAKKAISQVQVGVIDKAVDADPSLLKLVKSKMMSGDDGTLATAIKDTMKLGAYNLVASQHMDPTKAVQLMTASISTGKYDFSIDNTTVPKGMGDKVEAFAKHQIDNLKPADIAVRVAGPTPLTQDQNRPAETEEQAMKRVRNGSWITRPDDNGIMRLDEHGVPVKRKDGTFMEYDFDGMHAFIPLLPGANRPAVLPGGETMRGGEVK